MNQGLLAPVKSYVVGYSIQSWRAYAPMVMSSPTNITVHAECAARGGFVFKMNHKSSNLGQS